MVVAESDTYCQVAISFIVHYKMKTLYLLAGCNGAGKTTACAPPFDQPRGSFRRC